jgi:hypothetical protein
VDSRPFGYMCSLSMKKKEKKHVVRHMIIILHLFRVSFTCASNAGPKIFAYVLLTEWNHLFANKG